MHPQRDRIQLEKVYAEKDHLFTEETLYRRKMNGFWTCETVEEKHTEEVQMPHKTRESPATM